MRNESLEAQRIGMASVARSCPRDASVILDPDKEPSGSIPWAVRKAHHCIDQIPIGERSCLFTLELHIKRLAADDERADCFRRHARPP